MGLAGLRRQEKMDETKIVSLRMGNEDIQAMDSFIESHPEVGGRSLFIRNAIRQYISRDAEIPAETGNRDGKTLVELSPADKETLITLVDNGRFPSVDHAVWYFVYTGVQGLVKEEEEVRSIYKVASSSVLQ